MKNIRTMKADYNNVLEGGDAKDITLWNKFLNLFPDSDTREKLLQRQNAKTIKSLLAKQDKNDLDSMEGYRGDYGAWETPEDDIDSTYIASLLSDGEDDSIEEISEELSYDTGDQWVKDHMVDQSYNKVNSNAMDAKETYAESAVGRDSEVSGGMTDNVYGSDDPQMSPQMQKYALGLLKDYMEPDSDPAPQPVRGMGIVKGGGTPFPSLLQKKPERQRHVNKGLGLI